MPLGSLIGPVALSCLGHGEYGYSFGCHSWVAGRMLLASSGEGSAVWLSILQCTGQHPLQQGIMWPNKSIVLRWSVFDGLLRNVKDFIQK